MTAEGRASAVGARSWGALARVTPVAASLAPFLLAFVVYTCVWLSMRPSPTGDEPHYMIAAESLIYDGDVDLTNDYTSPERTLRVFGSFPLDHHAFHYAGHSSLAPLHGLGLSVLLAPAIGLGGLNLARLVMILIAALVADQLFRLLRELGVARPLYRWLAWAAVVFSLPPVAFSNQVYPELPAALVVLVWLRVIVRPRPSPRALLGATLAAATLPWLNVRYLSIFGLLALGLLVAAARTYGDRAAPVRRMPRTLWANRRPVGLRLVLPAVASVAALAATFQALYGSPSPDAPFRPATDATIGSAGWTFWYEFLLAQFLHPRDGWIPYAPVAWLGLMGIGCVLRIWGSNAGLVLAGVVFYLALVASTGLEPGWTFPARFLLVFIPLVAIPLALLLETVWESRLLFVPLLALSLYISWGVLGTGYTLLYPSGFDRHEPSNFPPVRHIQTAFPNMRPVILPTEARISPGGEGAVGRVEHGLAVAEPGDPNGYLLFGARPVLARGLYTATFPLRGSGTGTVGRVEVTTDLGRMLAQRPVRADELTGVHKDVVLEFATPGGIAIDARVWYAGRGRLEAGPARLDDQPGTVPPKERFERFADLQLAAVWIAGTAFLALLFAQLMTLRGTAPTRPRT